jgi:hypothetical protein
MVSYSKSLGLTKQGSGENDNTWGTVLNEEMISLTDQAIAGYGNITVASGVVTVTAGNGVSASARNAFIQLNGTLSANVSVVIPSVSKGYVIKDSTNRSASAFTIELKTKDVAGVTVPSSCSSLYVCNGSTVFKATPGVVSAGTIANSELPTIIAGKTINASTFVEASVSDSVFNAGIITATSISGSTFKAGSITSSTINATSLYVSATSTFKQRAVGSINSLTVPTSGTLKPDFSVGNFFEITLVSGSATGNTTFGEPDNLVAGQAGLIRVIQPATTILGCSFTNHYFFPAKTTVVPTSATAAVDIWSYYVGGDSKVYIVAALNFGVGS